MTEKNTNPTETGIEISKFKKFLRVVFGDIFFKLTALTGAVLVFLAFRIK